MNKTIRGYLQLISFITLSLIMLLVITSETRADEADAKRILKSMSDYMAAQKSISFNFDASLEVVTDDEQKLTVTTSGTATLNRPDKLHVTRTGGFVDLELFFDGKKLTLLDKNVNLYTQLDIPGTIYNMIDELSNKYYVPLFASDLLLENPYDVLMSNVYNIKDLGSGVVSGVKCDHLAFRTNNDVDWQIWIAQGKEPYPCLYVITTKIISGSPQYSIQVREWKTGSDATKTDFKFKNSTKAKKVDLKDLKGIEGLPHNFTIKGDTK